MNDTSNTGNESPISFLKEVSGGATVVQLSDEDNVAVALRNIDVGEKAAKITAKEERLNFENIFYFGDALVFLYFCIFRDCSRS